ncbi:M1 family metallopeptidase [Haloflavibacter putidus]|uniref:M1 family metallopeptidase n=1 Tax=Haloflavibacter putidus TaxID=2576776 RepID=A0A507ZNB7_9FLAO|nr:M1 family metallopeptidase [Haloflavibacter putidus]TQD37734.1 M1 family metallopeptidase [Haloflavibacter putidus]
MKIRHIFLSFFLIAFSVSLSAQEEQEQKSQKEERQEGHTNQNKFRQLYQEFATPNQYRTASGAPGPAYYQNTADYEMDIILDDENQKIYGEETITYTNNSPEELTYLWVQLDQNVRAKDSKSPLRNGDGMQPVNRTGSIISKYVEEPFDGGFKIQEVKRDGKDLPYKINQTMMRVDLAEPLESGDSYEFSIKWWYNINDHVVNRGRSGYEYFKENDNYSYVIAQFFPRMAVYNDVEGWQNYQFWGSGEFALPFGNYKVNITVPADHILDGTGKLQNRKKVFSKKMLQRYERAQKNYDKPTFLVTEEEAIKNEKSKSKKTKTWEFEANMVRDFAFTSSRKYIWEMQPVKMGDRDIMAVSIYSKEGNPLWEEYSTKAVVATLENYSKHTFDYPYHKAISVHAKNQGMEYPMICWNYGRPNPDGSYSERTKFGMISVIIHEIGHNYFPMIVNSDERQWGWMDEGLNTFMQYLTEQKFGEKHPEAIAPLDKYPSRRGEPSKITSYMKGEQDFIAPIMSNPEQVHQLGNNAYGKPATALNILRETVMGEELFDYAFKTFSRRWMFKHPTPEDFFRTMEDASAVDLDWYWRGWFYTTDYVDIGVENVKSYFLTDKPTQKGKEMLAGYGISDPSKLDAIYVVEEDSEEFNATMKKQSALENAPTLKEYMLDNFTPQERRNMEVPKHFYQITFTKPGGLVMPLIVKYEYKDGSSEQITYPAQIWRKNDQKVSRVLATDKELKSVVVDPNMETADIDVSNNSWPKKEQDSEFERFKKQQNKN